jgi:hypothetical protein
VISAIALVVLRFPREKNEYSGLRFHRKMLRKPDAVYDGHLLQFEAPARLHLCEKTRNRNRPYDGGFDLDPLKCFLVDPERAFHARQYLGYVIWAARILGEVLLSARKLRTVPVSVRPLAEDEASWQLLHQ